MRAMKYLIALVVVMGVHGSSGASDDCCQEPMPSIAADLSPNDEEAIIRAIEGYTEGFIAGDVRKLLNLWDTHDREQVTYVPVEKDTPIVGVQSLRPYYEELIKAHIVYSGEITNVQIHREGGMAYAFCNYTWVTRSTAGGPVMVTPTRATFVLRKRDGQWLYRHFHESVTMR